MNVQVYGDRHLAEVVEAAMIALGHDTTSQAHEAIDCVIFAYDTPVVDGSGDVDWIMNKFDEAADVIDKNSLVIIMSQVPVGTTAKLEAKYPHLRFAYVLENIKASDSAREYLAQPIIAGVRSDKDLFIIQELFRVRDIPYTMTIESAEMTKHTINAYLGMCISFSNEIGYICSNVGANPEQVIQGLFSDKRVSEYAPLWPGRPFGGGHIDRDLNYLKSIKPTTLISAIQTSNNEQK